MNIPIGIGGFLKNCSQPGIGTGSFSNFHTSMILVFESMADFWLVRGRSPNSTCAHSCYCGQYENSGALEGAPAAPPPGPPQSRLCPVFFHLVMFCTITSHVMSTKGLVTCQVACAKCLVACYIALALQMCMTWTQNMSGNAKVKKGCKRQTGGKSIAVVLLYC